MRQNLQKIAHVFSDRRYTVLMTDELLARAREQSEHSELSVRAPAWLHIARVERSFDPDAAHRTFQRGLDAVQQMVGDDRQLFLQLARNVAAAMDPGLLSEIPDEEGAPPFGRGHLVATMVAQGHVDGSQSGNMLRLDVTKTVHYRKKSEVVNGHFSPQNRPSWRRLLWQRCPE